MSRMTREEFLMETAELLSLRSTCNRLKVGAVLAKNGRIVATGYNGAPSGVDHCGDECRPDGPPCTRTVHAEANAIAFAARYGVITLGADLYTTASPCLDCAKLIINAGIRQVFYIEEYRDSAPLDLLWRANVVYEQLLRVPREAKS